jgi:hypothetical protein
VSLIRFHLTTQHTTEQQEKPTKKPLAPEKTAAHSMVSTRSRDKHDDHQQQPGSSPQDGPTQQPRRRASSSSSKIPTASEQEQQLQADRALIQEYRKQWQSSSSVSQAAVRWA